MHFYNKAGVLFLTATLTACGGGGSDSGGDIVTEPPTPDPDPVTSTDQRVSRIVEDLDLNGTADLITTFTYNDAARSVSMQVIYTDDGTPDALRFGDDAITQVNNTATFTESGLIESFRIENTLDNGSTSIITFTYTYQNEQLQSLTQSINNSEISIETTNQATYTNGLLSALASDNSGFIVRYALSYLDNGTLQTATRSVNDSVGEVANYTWRDDGQISGIEKTFTDRVETASLATTYSEAGILQSATFRDGRNPDFRTTNYTAHYTYDAQGKIETIGYDPLSTGSVQARAQYEWETGACNPIYGLNVGEIMLAHNALTESATYPAGVFSKLDGCIPDTE